MKKAKPGGLHEYVIDEIGHRIVAGDFAPGKALPSEAELCGSLGVSRTALREALRVLAAKGLLEARPKVGTLVRDVSSWNSLDGDIMTWRLQSGDSEQAITELYELRHLIEPIAAALAAKNAGAAQIAVMRDAYRQMQAAGDDGEQIIAPDLRFHQAIIAASGNRLFSSLAHVLQAALTVAFELVRDTPRGHRHSMPMHKKVLDAIVVHDPPAALAAMQKLIEDSQRDARDVRRNAGQARRDGRGRRPASTGRFA
jgi:DNA-binding FadR family transcriptional regulator